MGMLICGFLVAVVREENRDGEEAQALSEKMVGKVFLEGQPR